MSATLLWPLGTTPTSWGTGKLGRLIAKTDIPVATGETDTGIQIDNDSDRNKLIESSNLFICAPVKTGDDNVRKTLLIINSAKN